MASTQEDVDDPWEIRNNGIFAFNWCLFDWAEPVQLSEGQAPPSKPQVAVGPFLVKPTWLAASP